MEENDSGLTLKGLTGRLIIIFSLVIVAVIGFSTYVALESKTTYDEATRVVTEFSPIAKQCEVVVTRAGKLVSLAEFAVTRRDTIKGAAQGRRELNEAIEQLGKLQEGRQEQVDSLQRAAGTIGDRLHELDVWLKDNFVVVSEDSAFLAGLPERESTELPRLVDNVKAAGTVIQAAMRRMIQENARVQETMLASIRSRANVAYQICVVGGVVVILALTFGAIGYVRSFRKSLSAPVQILEKLVKGETSNGVIESDDEFGRIVKSAHALSRNLQEASTFAQKIGEGDVNHVFTPVSDQDMLGNSLVQMRDKLKNINEADRKRNWATEGLARFADILRRYDDYSELANTVISELVKYTGSAQGGMFTIQEEDSRRWLQLDACYAYERKKYITKQVELGEGLVGQCFLEARTIFLKKIPQDYVLITSGLGGANPSALILVPMKVNEEIEGVIELASFKNYEPHEIEFVEKLGEIIASSINSAKTNERTKKLLEDTQQQAEEMRAQEEEMRQNMEEMQATQEQLHRQTEEMQKMQQKLEMEQSMFHVLMEYLPDRITFKDRNSRVIRINKAKAVRFNIQPEEMIGKSDHDYFSKEHADKAYAEEQALIRSGVPLINIEERASLTSGDYVWASTSRIPFRNNRNETVGVFIITKDITKQKAAEASITDRERIIEQLIDSMPMFRYRIEKDGTVSQVSGSSALKGFDPGQLDFKNVKDCLPEVYDLLQQKDMDDLDLVGKGVVSIKGEMEIFKHYLFKDSAYDNVYLGFSIRQ